MFLLRFGFIGSLNTAGCACKRPRGRHVARNACVNFRLHVIDDGAEGADQMGQRLAGADEPSRGGGISHSNEIRKRLGVLIGSRQSAPPDLAETLERSLQPDLARMMFQMDTALLAQAAASPRATAPAEPAPGAT